MSAGEFAHYDPTAEVKTRAHALFSQKAVEVPFKSQQAGRPIFEDQEFVQILIPGDRLNVVHERVNETHIARWPKEYEAFKAGLTAPLEGTPLSEWPSSKITPARIAELQHFNIRTVEDLAGLNDAHIKNLGMGAYELRLAAQKFLEIAEKGVAPIERLITENMQLRDSDAAKTARIAELEAALAAKGTVNAQP